MNFCSASRFHVALTLYSAMRQTAAGKSHIFRVLDYPSSGLLLEYPGYPGIFPDEFGSAFNDLWAKYDLLEHVRLC